MSDVELFAPVICDRCEWHEAMPLSTVCLLCAEYAGLLGGVPEPAASLADSAYVGIDEDGPEDGTQPLFEFAARESAR